MRKMIKDKELIVVICDKAPIEDKIKMLESNIKVIRTMANTMSKMVRELKKDEEEKETS